MEDESMVSALKSLTFTTLPKIGANPVLDRRAKIIVRLEEQKVSRDNLDENGASIWMRRGGRAER